MAIACMIKQSKHQLYLEQLGFQLFALPDVSRSQFKLFQEIHWLQQLCRIYKQYRPDLAHHVALKPVIYGSFIARLLNVKCINALGGLGYLFTDAQEPLAPKIKKTLKRFVVTKILCCLTNAWGYRLVLQNADDLQVLSNHGVQADRTSIIPGNGVRIPQKPTHQNIKPLNAPVKIAFAARMLWSKGIAELIAAIEILQTKAHQITFPAFECHFYGKPDPENPSSVPEACLQYWENLNRIRWHGQVDSLIPHFFGSDLIVLPSYREGLPQALIEAAMCGKPIVATDVPGCRELVTDGYNGFLTPLGNVQALANALEQLILNPLLREQFGHNSQILSEKFALLSVGQAFFNLYQQCFTDLGKPGS